MNGAYYNEHDPKAAAWLRELIKAGHIAPGDVDERSITEVSPSDLANYAQCHFFAGIGGWSLALRMAGVPDSFPVWTGSCPCQPFSAAGKRKGSQDERHLWPSFARLIEARRPAIVFGEQVASKDGRGWLAGVFADLEGMAYQRAAADLCAASVGAPHIRQRLYWLAYAASQQTFASNAGRFHSELGGSGSTGRLADSNGGDASAEREQCSGELGLLAQGDGVGGLADCASERRNRGSDSAKSGRRAFVEDCGVAGGLEHAESNGREQRGTESSGWGTASGCGTSGLEHTTSDGWEQWWAESSRRGIVSGRSAWDSFDLLPCTDGKARRVESLSFWMAHGLSAGLDAVWNDSIAKVEKTINAYAKKTNSRPIEVMRALRNHYRENALRLATGGPEYFSKEALLFAALCELARKLGYILNGAAQGICEEPSGNVQRLRQVSEEESNSSCPPQRREHAQQLSDQLANAVRELPQEIAHNLMHNWPLAHGVPGRVGLLRGYGNAIVPQVAAEFIQAGLEAIA